MPIVRFTQNIQRHVPCPDCQVQGNTVSEALEAYFKQHPRARSYVLNDRSELRQHMIVFVAGEAARDRVTLSDPVQPDDTIDVMQALSGG